ncbi:MAG: energy-coupled thiamine transporter ThiT [Clostridia bacterium]|nr:energy-coupled thiamine transporter ThiT [Clostridia bacterium]
MSYLLSAYAVDTAEPIVKWTTIAVLGLVLIAGIVLLFTKKELFSKLFKPTLLCVVIYAAVVGILMLSLDIAKHYDPQYLEDNWVNKDIVNYVFVPGLITAILFLITAISLFVISNKKPDWLKMCNIISGALIAAAVITTIVTTAVFYSRNIEGDGYYTGEYGELNSSNLYISAVALVVGLIAIAFFSDRKESLKFDSRSIAFAGITIALSFALSYIRLFKLPQGGSVTLASLVPIMLFAYIYGAKKGVIVGVFYGLLQAIQDPFIIHPAQFLLDYPIAFAFIGLAGCLKNVNILPKFPQVKFTLSALIASIGRFLAHILSGVFAFGAYAKDAGAESLFAYSTAYNSFVFVDIAIAIGVGVLLLSSKSFTNELTKRTRKKAASVELNAEPTNEEPQANTVES